MLADRRITPKAQGVKVRAQGTKVRTQGAKVKDQHPCKSVRDAETAFNYNHHHRPGPAQHDAAMTATCIRVQVALCGGIYHISYHIIIIQVHHVQLHTRTDCPVQHYIQ